METATLKLMGRPPKSEKSVSIRIPQSFVKKLRRLALHHKKDPGDYLKEQFGAALDKLHAKMLAEQMKEAEQRGNA